MMTTDRELLALAAKAAGLDVHWVSDDGAVLMCPIGKHWNPLTDDGAALRLAVKLGLDLERREVPMEGVTIYVGSANEDVGADPYAATRRAIVRAAAEIGRQLEVTR
jgi:hypothetical protein